ncbi:hypothetical protein FOQG_16885 [Fusarium oxysporum f. sp. raphani 54005]|uniref:Uncharacterized protein n=1 Tax=Fusarium oxysporum f. sp. raphani 54005 TaxID=1089458 RepID=X0BHV1_FUSOX|nr:hypothetical protein FOQG_16885 [Fusarium oxysporum f. sp. raphani 54005]
MAAYPCSIEFRSCLSIRHIRILNIVFGYITLERENICDDEIGQIQVAINHERTVKQKSSRGDFVPPL